MKLTLTWHGKTKTYTGHLSLRQVVSASVLCSLVFIVSSRSTDSGYEDLARISLAQQKLDKESEQIAAMRDSVNQQLAVYAQSLATLSHHVESLDSSSQALADNLNLSLPKNSHQPSTQGASAVSAEITDKLDRMQRQIDNKQQQLALLEKVFKGHHVDQQVEVSGRPIKWGWLSSHYGMRDDPFTGEPAMHRGLDFAGRQNGEVISTGAGIVTWAGERYGYGLLVEVDHGQGLVTRYGHNSAVNVQVGDVVTKGQTLAAMGSTGRSTGVHVHYEVLKHGKQVDPLAFVR